MITPSKLEGLVRLCGLQPIRATMMGRTGKPSSRVLGSMASTAHSAVYEAAGSLATCLASRCDFPI